MGVMSCSRRDCENIMCDTYIDTIGYICGDCKREFEDKLGYTVLPAGEMYKKLKEFMATSAGYRNMPGGNEEVTAFQFLDKYRRE